FHHSWARMAKFCAQCRSISNGRIACFSATNFFPTAARLCKRGLAEAQQFTVEAGRSRQSGLARGQTDGAMGTLRNGQAFGNLFTTCVACAASQVSFLSTIRVP